MGVDRITGGEDMVFHELRWPQITVLWHNMIKQKNPSANKIMSLDT